MKMTIRTLFFSLISLFFLLIGSAFAQTLEKEYAFDRISHDFGTLKVNETGTAVFEITNTGNDPLVLLDVKVSCRCAKIKWPKQPIPPGKSADLTVTYKDKETGAFYKTIHITTNKHPRQTQLTIKGSIK